MPKNATVFSLLSSGWTLAYYFVLLEINIHRWLHGESWNLAPSAKGKLLKMLFSCQNHQKPLVSLCLYLISQLHSTQMDTPTEIHSVLLASTASLCLDLPSTYLASSSTLTPGISPGLVQLSSLSSLSILSSELIIQTWTLNTSCLLIIPKFISHPQTSTLNSILSPLLDICI